MTKNTFDGAARVSKRFFADGGGDSGWSAPRTREQPARLHEDPLEVRLAARDFYVAVAKMGGYMLDPHKRRPGWVVLWRGYTRLEDMCEGARLGLRHVCKLKRSRSRLAELRAGRRRTERPWPPGDASFEWAVGGNAAAPHGRPECCCTDKKRTRERKVRRHR